MTKLREITEDGLRILAVEIGGQVRRIKVLGAAGQLRRPGS
jgi:hypothetical protein